MTLPNGSHREKANAPAMAGAFARSAKLGWARAIRIAIVLATLGALALPASAGAFVYWANEGDGTIGRANVDGSGVDQDFIPGASGEIITGVAVDGGHVYWSQFLGGLPPNFGAIGRANLDGSLPNQSFIWRSDIFHTSGVAVNDAHIYW